MIVSHSDSDPARLHCKLEMSPVFPGEPHVLLLQDRLVARSHRRTQAVLQRQFFSCSLRFLFYRKENFSLLSLVLQEYHQELGLLQYTEFLN